MLGLEPHPLHQLLDLAAKLGPRGEAVELERVADDLPHPLAWVERRIGVLEDHLDLAADRAEALPREPDQLLAAELDRARRRLEQLDDGSAERRLAAAGLAHEAEGLALVEGEADVVDGLDARDLAVEEEPGLDREVLDEVLDLKERITLGHG
jgi:hypothetical protein